MGLSWALRMGSQIFPMRMLQPKAYRSGASKYQGLWRAPWALGGQYCKDNFFSGLEMYFLHICHFSISFLVIFPLLSFSFFLTILYRPFPLHSVIFNSFLFENPAIGMNAEGLA